MVIFNSYVSLPEGNWYCWVLKIPLGSAPMLKKCTWMYVQEKKSACDQDWFTHGINTGWWLLFPTEWKVIKAYKSHVPNHQPVIIFDHIYLATIPSLDGLNVPLGHHPHSTLQAQETAWWTCSRCSSVFDGLDHGFVDWWINPENSHRTQSRWFLC